MHLDAATTVPPDGCASVGKDSSQSPSLPLNCMNACGSWCLASADAGRTTVR